MSVFDYRRLADDVDKLKSAIDALPLVYTQSISQAQVHQHIREIQRRAHVLEHILTSISVPIEEALTGDGFEIAKILHPGISSGTKCSHAISGSVNRSGWMRVNFEPPPQYPRPSIFRPFEEGETPAYISRRPYIQFEGRGERIQLPDRREILIWYIADADILFYQYV